MLIARVLREGEPLAGCGYCGVDGDDGIEPRDFEHPSHLPTGTCHAKSRTGLSGRQKALDNHVCAGAVDVRNASEVEYQFLLVLVQQILHHWLDHVLRPARCDAAGELHNDNVRFDPSRLYLQAHMRTPAWADKNIAASHRVDASLR